VTTARTRPSTARTKPSPARTKPSPVPGPQLGATTFEEWFDTPVFEVGVDPDERLEQLATSKRRTARLFGSAALRWRGRRATGRADLPLDLRVEGEDRGAAAPPALAAERRERRAGHAREDRGAAAAPPPLPAAGTPRRSGSQSASGAGRPRRRLDDFLDRWAEKEAAGQQRLERLVLPRRWRA
jgi:hypothetical protein